MKRKIIQRSVANNTRTNIIKAARKLFAESGFFATTTQAIAKAAKVNETLIFHHFGNKEKLWRVVKQDVIDNISFIALNSEPATLHDFLQSIFAQRLEAYQKQPALMRLLQWQRLESKQKDLVAGNRLAPNNWLIPLKYLQNTNKITTKVPVELIMVWLLASINAMILDNFTDLQNQKNRDIYLQTLIMGFEKALAP